MDFEKDRKIYDEIKAKFGARKGEAVIVSLDHEDIEQCTKTIVNSIEEIAEVTEPLAAAKKCWAVFDHLENPYTLYAVFSSFCKEENLQTSKVTRFIRRVNCDPLQVAQEFRKLEDLLNGCDSKAS
jgi:hypothetical protein